MLGVTTHRSDWHRAYQFIRNELGPVFKESGRAFEKDYEKVINKTKRSDNLSSRVKKIVVLCLSKFKKGLQNLRSRRWYRWIVKPILTQSLFCLVCPLLPQILGCGLGFLSGVPVPPGLPNVVKKALSKLTNTMMELLPDSSIEAAEQCSPATV